MADNLSYEIALALADAISTKESAMSIVKLLRDKTDQTISFANRQRDELATFIEVFQKELARFRRSLDESRSSINLQLLLTRRMELEEVVRYIDRAFIQPRRGGYEVQILEAADWMCVEGFQLFVPEGATQPIGPMVAIDSALSPAVWAPDANLPIPSLFKVTPKRMDRGEALPPFPLICLPGHLAQSPEYLPLLSHEVGHAVDYCKKFSATILEEIKAATYLRYWTAWMREIVADSIGITLSGEAFIEALKRYLDQLTPLDEVSTANAYPANLLRLAFAGAMAKQYDANWRKEDAGCIPDDDQVRGLNRTAISLLKEFRSIVLPSIAKNIFKANTRWKDEGVEVRQLAERLANSDERTWTLNAFRLTPSAVIIAQRICLKKNKPFDSFHCLRDLHKSVPADKRPAWVLGKANWTFSEDYLPTLRPTFLGIDGKFKVPPVLLLTTHQKIAFVGATNWQLCSKLAEAFKARSHVPWETLTFFFASDSLLKQVEYGEFDSVQHRDESRAEIEQSLRTKNWAKNWTIYEFNGPPLFASYWDWDARGGRIHISAALLGTVIGECPATDQIWIQESPTEEYKKYVKHLKALMKIVPGTIVKSSLG